MIHTPEISNFSRKHVARNAVVLVFFMFRSLNLHAVSVGPGSFRESATQDPAWAYVLLAATISFKDKGGKPPIGMSGARLQTSFLCLEQTRHVVTPLCSFVP